MGDKKLSYGGMGWINGLCFGFESLSALNAMTETEATLIFVKFGLFEFKFVWE